MKGEIGTWIEIGDETMRARLFYVLYILCIYVAVGILFKIIF